MIQNFLNDNEEKRTEIEEKAEQSSFIGKLQKYVIMYGVTGMCLWFCAYIFGNQSFEEWLTNTSFEDWIFLWPIQIYNLVF